MATRLVLRLSKAVTPAARPPGRGWQPIPKGRKGGFRRKRSGRGWEYWYPDTPQGRQKVVGREVQLDAEQLDRLLTSGTFSVISAGRNPRDPDEAALDPSDPKFARRHEQLKADVAAAGLNYTEVEGHYEGEEASIVVFHGDSAAPMAGSEHLIVHHTEPSEFARIRELGAKYNQDSVIHAHRGRNEMHYTAGPQAGTFHAGQGFAYVPTATDFYTLAPTEPEPTKFSLNFDFDSQYNAEDAILKSAKPPGKGWEPIPRGKKGGYRRRKRTGKGYEYWYPDKAASGKLKPGATVTVGTGGELFEWTPDYAPTGEGRTYVRSKRTGKYKIVREASLRPASRKRARQSGVKTGKKRRGRKAPPPPKKSRGRKKGRKPAAAAAKHGRKMVRVGDQDIPAEWNTPDTPPAPPQGYEEPGDLTPRRAKPYRRSQAPKGSMLAKLEGGQYMLRQYQPKHARRMRLTIEVPGDARDPTSDKSKLLAEVQNVIHSATREVAKKWRVPVYAPTGGFSPDYEELVGAAHVGFMMCLGNYRGDRAFVPYLRDYAKAYALQAVRQIRRGVTIPDSKMRVLAGYAAAKSRARTLAREKREEDPTPEQIATTWYLTKRDVWTGRADTLGRYATKRRDPDTGKTETVFVDQAYEQVPDTDRWRVKTPTGKEEGPSFPSKVELVREMERLIAAEDVPDDDWMANRSLDELPENTAAALPAGTALHIRGEIRDILGKMKEPKRTALAMKWGVWIPEDEDREALSGKSKKQLKALAKERGLRVGGSKAALVDRIHEWASMQDRPGTAGRQATAAEVAEALDLTGHKGKKLSAGSLAAKVRRMWRQGVSEFWRRADMQNAEVSNFLKEWNRDILDPPNAPKRTQAAWFPTHAELRQKFGTDERVYVYQAAIRAGKAGEVAPILEAEAAGKATQAQSQAARKIRYDQERKEAKAKFARYQAVTADPNATSDLGPAMGTPGEADWLYTDNVLSGFMRASITPE